jgi:hypothetical protein
MSKTIITHFYNEEYLLPRWLEHHRKFFNHGILIDYQSTDRSVEICREICPTWSVVRSKNREFDANACDREIMDYEKQIKGWRIALTVTEFLVGDVLNLMSESLPDPLYLSDPNCRTYLLQMAGFNHWDPEGEIDPTIDLWHQFKHGIDCKRYPEYYRSRSLHNHKFMNYTTGRHFDGSTVDNVYIFKYSNVIANQAMLKRRLQIQNRIPEINRQMSQGWHHYSESPNDPIKVLTKQKLYNLLTIDQHKVTDCSTFVDQVISKMS